MRTRRDCTIRGRAPSLRAFRAAARPRRSRRRRLEASNEMNPAVVISTRGEQRIAAGHPWIYRADVADVRGKGGDIVLVRDPRGRPLGHAMYSSASQIALRMLTHGEKPADEALIRRRIESAIA